MDLIKDLKEKVVKNDLKIFHLAVGRIKLSFIEVGKTTGRTG